MHHIRLRTPWTLEILEQTSLSTPALKFHRTAEVPGDWSALLGAAFRGRVRYTRSFNSPTCLQAGQRIWLVLEGVTGEAEVRLGDRLLGVATPTACPSRYNISNDLQHRNLLSIDITQPSEASPPGGLTGEVRLEIES